MIHTHMARHDTHRYEGTPPSFTPTIALGDEPDLNDIGSPDDGAVIYDSPVSEESGCRMFARGSVRVTAAGDDSADRWSEHVDRHRPR
jgi:hypothetical protein